MFGFFQRLSDRRLIHERRRTVEREKKLWICTAGRIWAKNRDDSQGARFVVEIPTPTLHEELTNDDILTPEAQKA